MWITNQFFDPTNQKLVKLSFSVNCFFPKYNFETISTDDICLSICLALWVRLNNEATKLCKLCCKILKFKIIINIFFTKQYFFLNSNPANLFICFFFLFLTRTDYEKSRFLFAMVLCSRFIWVTNSSDHRRVSKVTTLYARDSQFKLSCGHWNLWSK